MASTANQIALGDVIAIRGKGLLSTLISGVSGIVSHVGIVTATGDNYADIDVTQALEKVSTLSLVQTLAHAKFGYCLHCNDLAYGDRVTIATYALSRLGKAYPYSNLAWQLMKQVTGNPKWTEYLDSDTNEICSELASDAYMKVGRDFGVAPRDCTPSDCFRYAIASPNWQTFQL